MERFDDVLAFSANARGTAFVPIGAIDHVKVPHTDLFYRLDGNTTIIRHTNVVGAVLELDGARPIPWHPIFAG